MYERVRLFAFFLSVPWIFTPESAAIARIDQKLDQILWSIESLIEDIQQDPIISAPSTLSGRTYFPFTNPSATRYTKPQPYPQKAGSFLKGRPADLRDPPVC